MTPDSTAVSFLFAGGAVSLLLILAFGALRKHLDNVAQTKYGADLIMDRAVGKHPALAAGYGKSKPLRRFKIKGKVLKVWDGPDVVLASGECVKEAESADALKAAWEADMKRAFPTGPDYNVEYHCTITPLDESDDDAVKAAIAAEVATVTMFR